MIHTRPFTRRIILLGVLPVFIAICFLSAGFVIAQGRLIKSLEQQISDIAESTMLPILADKSLPDTTTERAAETVLRIETISHLTIYDASNGEMRNLARPLNDIRELPLKSERAAKSLGNVVFSTTPIPDEVPNRWLVVGVQKSALEVTEYQGYLILMSVAILVLLLTLHFASQLYDAVTTPLKDILTDLRQTLLNNSDKPLSNSKNHLYNELIETLNEMIVMQQSIRDEMQTNVDQSTKELRETLETVEIQNIELDFARKNALQASRAKSEFLANTSHELRTPLNGILGFTSLLLKTTISNQQKDYLTTIEQSAQGLLTVINDILDFSKLETGQLTLEYKPIYVRELIEEVFAVYAPQAHEKNMRLVSIINHNVPRNLLGDPQRLKQVITNLISNSIKFSLHGNIVVRAISLGEMDNQIEIKFSVSDNGIGLSQEQQENLFSAFTKVDNSDSRFQGGTGLGLAIAKGLVDRMKGEIGVESELQKGATFWFTVRLGIDRQRISQSPFVNSLYGLNALIFDCNPVCRMEITHLLSNWGVNFVEENAFNNIPNLIAANHEEQSIDILILDAFTEENGFDRERLLTGIQRIRMTFKLPVVVLAPPAIQRILQDEIAGLNAIIVQRPVVHSQLHQAMCSLLNIAQRLPNLIDGADSSQPPLKNNGLRILVVDDNPANLKLVCEFLRALGVETRAHSSGYDAIETCEKESFDLILMDVQMPGMDGLETTKALRARETDKRTPVVALTAHAVNEQKTQLLLAGMDDFLSKPVSEDDLKHIIERWTKHRDSDDQQPDRDVKPQMQASLDSTAANSPQARRNGFFDWSESLRLAKHKPDLAADMLKMLLASLPSTRNDIQAAQQQGDTQRLLEIVHKLHGGCCYCGVPALRSASKTLEEKLHKQDFTDLNERIAAVINEIRVLTQWSEEIDLEVLFADYDD